MTHVWEVSCKDLTDRDTCYLPSMGASLFAWYINIYFEVLHSTTEISESGRARKGRAEEEKPGTESADTQPDDARDKKVLRPRALPPSL